MSKKTLTFALMDPPFENERTTTALRIIEAACRKGHNVNVFAYEGAVFMPFAHQKQHANSVKGTDLESENHPLTRIWIAELQQLAVAHGGRLDWVNCGLCVDERGANDAITGIRRGSPADLVQFLEGSDNSLVIATR